MPESPIALVLPTLNGAAQLEACVAPWLSSPLVASVHVWDSASTDHTVALAKSLGCHVTQIERDSFGHGKTREAARKSLSSPYVAFVSQDVVLQNSSMIEALLAPIASRQAAVSFARQIPSSTSSWFDAQQRELCYPRTSRIHESTSPPVPHPLFECLCSLGPTSS